ncbi:ABC transporter substrate-binding protein [Corynebacterium neomassiliense]|uniref:ABC transporter substrate-binding protein n=1 Tax=Corynebacterium neomassiliense TaxID=2079482 RepID=UPI00192A5E5E|nr:ABC transporter substrate-binding protein [Corynebacterium neomassiliense]
MKIDSQPERIVALGLPAVEATLGLGIRPVAAGISEKLLDRPYLEQFKGEDYVDSDLGTITSASADLNYEKIAQYDPDLIVVPDWDALAESAVSEKLSGISTVLYATTPYQEGGWESGVQEIAAAVNEERSGDELIDRVSSAISDSAEGIPEANGKTYNVAVANDDGGVTLSPTGQYVLRGFGMTPEAGLQAEVDSRVSGNNDISAEQLGSLTADYVFLFEFQDGGAAVKSNPFYSSIQNRVVWFDNDLSGSMNNGGVLAQEWLTGEVAEKIAESSSVR